METLANYYDPKTPFDITKDEDWNLVQKKWYVRYNCKVCGEKHVKRIWQYELNDQLPPKDLRCQKVFSYENPFIVSDNNNWNEVKTGSYIKYKCKACGDDHITQIDCGTSHLKCIKYSTEKNPFIISDNNDWKKVIYGMYVKYKCEKCGNFHIKEVYNDVYPTCLLEKEENQKKECIKIMILNKLCDANIDQLKEVYNYLDKEKLDHDHVLENLKKIAFESNKMDTSTYTKCFIDSMTTNKLVESTWKEMREESINKFYKMMQYVEFDKIETINSNNNESYRLFYKIKSSDAIKYLPMMATDDDCMPCISKEMRNWGGRFIEDLECEGFHNLLIESDPSNYSMSLISFETKRTDKRFILDLGPVKI